MKTHFPILCALCLLLLCGPARAALLYSYDLDSLDTMSSQVVEADIIGDKPTKGLKIVRARVMHSYKGRFNQNQTIELIALDAYLKSGKDSFQTRKLESGDHLFLWLVKVSADAFYGLPKNADIYLPVPSGVKLVQDGKVLYFRQFSNPGPYQTVTADRFSRGRSPALAEFRASLATSLERVRVLKAKFDAPAVAADVPWLKELLRSSASDGFSARNQIAEDAATRLTKVAAAPVLADALLQSRDYNVNRILSSGLNTAAGRALLLRRIADAKEPRANRLSFAGAVNGFDLLMNPDAATLNDVARVATRVQSDEALTGALLQALGASSQISYGSPQEARAAAQKWRPALEQLRRLHAQTSSPRLRFQIEMLTFNADPQRLKQFYPTLGPVLSLIHAPDDTAQYGAPKGRALVFEYEIRRLQANPQGWTPQIELINLATKKRFYLTSPGAANIPDSFDTQAGSSGGSEAIAIPARVPPGQYLVRYRFSRNGRVVSVGHGFKAKL